MEAAAVPSPPHPSTSPPTTAVGNTATSSPSRESGDVVSGNPPPPAPAHQQSQHQANTGSGRGYQLPQRFRAKREKNRQQQQQHHQQQFHGTGNNNNNNKKDPPVAAVAAVAAAAAAAAAAGMSREEINLNSLLATARHGLPIPFPAASSPPGYMGVPGGGRGPLNFGGGMGGGGVIMFPAPNGQVITKIGLYKEPLLPSGPPPLLPHHGGLHFSPLAFAHHANVKAAMHAMGMFSPNNRKDHGFKYPPPPMLPETPKPPAYSPVDLHKARIHSRSESASHALGQINSRSTSSTSSSPGGGGSNHDASLKKLMKDLHRCEVSIARYQTMLNEHCDAGLRFLRQAFITLHIGLNTREKDIARELQITRQTAGVILQRRHTTACILRQLAERAGELEETQVHELKKQIKQFVADRKVDEEIGTTSRFIGDPDDLLPHVMTFGKVVNRRHVYTHWEGDPAAAVEKSKHTSTRSSTSVFSSPPSSLPTTPSPIHSNEHTTPTATTAVPATKSNGEVSHGDPKSDDSVFERESPSVEKDSSISLDLEVNEEVGATHRGGEKREEEKSEVACGEVEEERKESVGDVPDGDSISVSQCPRGCGKEGDAPQSSSSSSATRGVKTAGTHPPATLDSCSDSRQESTPSSPPTSSSTACLNSTPAVSGSNSPSVSSGDSPAKPPPASTVSVSHKSRQPFSRKFAPPIVVTHTRRSFPKSLPKNLDPKSTVTILLSSPSSSSSSSSTSDKSQQKHGKHGNKNKSFNSRRGQFPSSSSSSYHPALSSITTKAEGDQEETLTSRDSQPTSSASSSSLSVRLKGREKERELWRKRFSSSSSLPSSSSGSGGAGEGGGKQGSMSGEEGGGGVRVKRSPEEMSAIQSRVRESLKAQGVFLYDPVTGAIPAESLRESVDSGVGKSEPHLSDSLRSSSADLKKKTPTQLRRERKKRQRERERRQKELERKGQEEGGSGSGGGDKQREGGRLSILTDKTSASTSRTTSPLSSLENSTSDTPTESVSPSRSLSPPPPPLSPSDTSNGLGEQGDRPARRGENDNTFPKTGSKSVPAGSQLVSSLSEDGDSLSTKTGTNTEVGAPVTARKVGGSPGLMMSADSASIEWEMSRQQRRRHKGVDIVTPLHQSQTHSTGGSGSSVTGVVNQTSSLPSPSSSSPPLALTRNGLTHSNHASPTSAHLAQQQGQQCPSAVICTTPSSGTSPSSVNCTNGTTELSSKTPSPSSHQPTSTINPSCTLRKLPATSRQMMCPNKFQQNGNEEGPILIINGHEE